MNPTMRDVKKVTRLNDDEICIINLFDRAPRTNKEFDKGKARAFIKDSYVLREYYVRRIKHALDATGLGRVYVGGPDCGDALRDWVPSIPDMYYTRASSDVPVPTIRVDDKVISRRQR